MTPTFLEELQSHRGSLIRIKSELYWYGGRGWDGSPVRVCLVLDASAAARTAGTAATSLRDMRRSDMDAALLLIDDRPQWICVSREDVELIT